MFNDRVDDQFLGTNRANTPTRTNTHKTLRYVHNCAIYWFVSNQTKGEHVCVMFALCFLFILLMVATMERDQTISMSTNFFNLIFVNEMV